MKLGKKLWPLLSVMSVGFSSAVFGHDVAEHPDPELLSGWLTWLHLTVQWTHLVSFALWSGVTLGSLVLGLDVRLERLLLLSWMLFLLLLATGTYNMEWSAGISETPSILMLPLVERIPYGIPYTISLTVKTGLFTIAVLITLVITLAHMGGRGREKSLVSFFLFSQSILILAITLAAAVVLFYHEAADLWPTPAHSLGGVVGPEGSPPLAQQAELSSSPSDFRLLANPAVWVDILVRWVHLLGFGLWLGSAAVALLFGPVSAGRFLVVLWAALILQVISGIASTVRWTPFYLPPYLWNLSELSPIRFARSYTLFLAAKHLLVGAALAFLIVWTIRYLRAEGIKQLSIWSLAAVSLFLSLAIGYIMMIVLLLHEGVDHAL